MNLDINDDHLVGVVKERHPVFKVTTVSKYLALMLFVLLPFIGGYVGYTYAPGKVVEVSISAVDEISTTTSPSVEEVFVDFKTGTYAVGRARHVDGNAWFDTSILYSHDRGYTWERYASIYDGYIPKRVYVLYDSLYFSAIENVGVATGTVSKFFRVDLQTKEKTIIGEIDGYVSDFAVTPQGIIAAVPTNRSCLDKATNCMSEVFNLESGKTTSVGRAKGVWIEAYGNRGLVFGGGYGDAGCRSYELYDYQRTTDGDLVLQDEFKDASCYGDEKYPTFTTMIEQKINQYSDNIDPYYQSFQENSFELETVVPLKISAKDTESDRMELADSEFGFVHDGIITVLQYKTPQGGVSGALGHFRADAQTSIPDFNLDQDKYPRDLLYPDGGLGKILPMSEVSKFISPEHCLVVYNNGVHDITALLRLDHTVAAVSKLRDKCGTDVDEFISSQPVQAGSLNTARFAYAMSNFWIRYWIDR